MVKVGAETRQLHVTVTHLRPYVTRSETKRQNESVMKAPEHGSHICYAQRALLTGKRKIPAALYPTALR